MNRTHFIILSFFLLALSACTMPSQKNKYPTPQSGPFGRSSDTVMADSRIMQTQNHYEQSVMQSNQQTPQVTTNQASGKIAVLLPLSGQHSNLGQSMLQAAQLALFDMGDTAVEIIPLDTKGTPQGAINAVQQAARQNAKLIIGPLLANNVQAAGETARQHDLNVIGFTTDWTKAGGNIFTIGILPFDQGTRLAEYAGQKNARRVLAFTTNDTYSNAVLSSFRNTASQYGVQIVQMAQDNDIPQLATRTQSFDAVLIPYGGQAAMRTVARLKQSGMGHLLKMGTGLWDEASFKSNADMSGAVFTAPSYKTRANFEQNYKGVYGQTPPRLSSLAYDATALTIILLRQGSTITKAQIMNPAGFAGIDGIFKFGFDGRAQRGLAIHKITGRGNSVIVDQAPKSF